MSGQREPNPLRPYYVPPSVGHASDAHHGLPSSPNISNKYAPASSKSFGSSARNILADMDYTDYISESSPAPTDLLKGLVEQALWKYTSVFLAQPFEVAKTVLQVHVATGKQKTRAKETRAEDARRRHGSYRGESYGLESSDSDLDSPSYFTSSAPSTHTPTHPPRGRRRRASPSPDGIPRVHPPQSPPSKASPHLLDLKSSSSILSALSILWNAEGAWGIWKGTNSTYVYSILLSTITSFVRSFFSAFLALPDPGLSFTANPSGPSSYTGGLDILSSPSPLSSLAVAVSAAGIAGIVLAPLDIARTKLILTPSTHPPRSIIATLNSLPSWTLPFSLAPTAVLHSTLPTSLSASTPLFLRSKMGIDPLLTPNLYAIATFCSQLVELGIKLPIETVLRRGQMDIARSTTTGGRDLHSVVEIGPYRGLFGTMRSIVYDEGERGVPAAVDIPKGGKGAPGMKVDRAGQQRRKGQGVEGLYRGWRVGMWGLVGVWGAATLGGAGSKGGEF